ncbi:GyrI-like domain-containing protein [Rhodanobacter terrae]|uniref:GyrI-like domain-containing protein n=1 Tax=Rhodanobacter terrae TaxID=418647 RepID=A0ABW0T073_9GAMM
MPSGQLFRAASTRSSPSSVPAITSATHGPRCLVEWLPSSGLQLDARPCFEHYPNDAKSDPQTGAFECATCIPVVSL